MAKSIVSDFVNGLKDHEKIALWFQTEPGLDWLYDDREEIKETPPVFIEDIAEYIANDFVYFAAGVWENRRTRRFLDGQY